MRSREHQVAITQTERVAEQIRKDHRLVETSSNLLCRNPLEIRLNQSNCLTADGWSKLENSSSGDQVALKEGAPLH